jgi:hypothetical protein
MRQKPAETALEFLYRLNEAGVKANVRFRKSKSECAEHIKRFLKNPRDPQLKIVLRNQRFRRLDDLELVLQQDEDLSLDGGNATPPPPPRTRDYRTDHPSPGRFKPRRSGNAYVAVSEPESDEDVKPHVRFEEEVEEVKPAPPESKSLGRDSPNGDPSNAPAKNVLSESEIRSLVFRAMANSGWRPPGPVSPRPGGQAPRPGWQSPRRENPDRLEFCENCNKFGHKEKNCWKDVTCDRCGRLGHPDYACRSRPVRSAATSTRAPVKTTNYWRH